MTQYILIKTFINKASEISIIVNMKASVWNQISMAKNYNPFSNINLVSHFRCSVIRITAAQSYPCYSNVEKSTLY